ncbi:Panacea domain-containing protein [Bacterioplanoides sp.]|uniref:Panacea domain-containing protein n=1 Tax=Bacterioplanoides sp. TaxID=2066072 RepID=UPI003B5BF49B
MAISAIAIANAFIDLGKENGCTDLTPMKLQKLVYFAHGWNLAVSDESLIDEQVEAWQYGPVVGSIYHAAKMFGNSSISQYLLAPAMCSNGIPSWQPKLLSSSERSAVMPLLNWIWSQYGRFTGVALSNMTHEENTPWKITVDTHGGNIPRNTDIDIEIIRNHFKMELAQAQALIGAATRVE